MKYLYSALVLVLALFVSSCGESLSSGSDRCQVTVLVAMPDDLDAGTLSAETYTFRNVTTTDVTTQASPIVALLPGLYDVSYEAMFVADDSRVFKLRAQSQSCVFTGPASEVRLQANNIVDVDDLIICEIFFAGTLQPSGISYNGDDYITLYNNTDHVIYADGITLFESKFSTTEKNAYTPDIMDQAMTVQALYTVPGSGREHPVAPGAFLILADNGIDHRVANPNSFDLSHADFEWYDVSSSPTNLDIDSPTVPNLDKWYCYTRSYWMLHNRGFKAYGLARIPIDRDSYLRDYYYSYDYEVVTAAGSFPMTAQAYKMPNEWIVDVVNCSVASDFAWCVCAPALDCGWTSCGVMNNDKNRFSKSVRRKLMYVEPDGRAVLRDTNNSTADFNASVTPSMLETTPTYDGITPKAQ